MSLRAGAGGAPDELRVAAFVTVPQPFQVPIYRHLRERHGIVTDLYCLRADAARGWGDTSRLYPVAGFGRELRAGPVRVAFPPRALLAAIRKGQCDAVFIGGWERLAHVRVHSLCASCGVPVIVGSDLRGGPGGMAGKKRSWLRRAIRDRVVPRIISRARGALVPGAAAAACLREMGFRGPLGIGLFGIDCELFSSEAREYPQGGLGLLYCGRLIEKKRAGDAVEAVARLAARGVPAHLVVAGDGPARGRIEQVVRDEGVEALVTMKGAVPHSEVAALMRAADALVLPTAGEAWGAVVVEAAACGAALVVSDQVGAASDVVRDGQNGCIFTTACVDSLVAGLERLWRDKQLGRMRDIGRLSRSLAERYSFEECARVYAETIRAAVSGRHVAAGAARGGDAGAAGGG